MQHFNTKTSNEAIIDIVPKQSDSTQKRYSAMQNKPKSKKNIQKTEIFCHCTEIYAQFQKARLGSPTRGLICKSLFKRDLC